DDLRGDVTSGARHDEPRTDRRAGDPLADTQMTTRSRDRLALALDRDSHRHLPAFPALRRTTSPAYRTPLPLYGSGLRILRMFAATSPTCCFEMPLTENFVGLSTAKVMPSGGEMTTGWLKPSWNSRSEPFAATR